MRRGHVPQSHELEKTAKLDALALPRGRSRLAPDYLAMGVFRTSAGPWPSLRPRHPRRARRSACRVRRRIPRRCRTVSVRDSEPQGAWSATPIRHRRRPWEEPTKVPASGRATNRAACGVGPVVSGLPHRSRRRCHIAAQGGAPPPQVLSPQLPAQSTTFSCSSGQLRSPAFLPPSAALSGTETAQGDTT
jgi:hypothetical protein